MADEFKALMVEQMLDIVPGACEEIVQADDLRALRQKSFTKVRAKKPDPPVTSIRCSRCISPDSPSQSLIYSYGLKLTGLIVTPTSRSR